MIRLAVEADLPAIGAVYEEVLDLEDARPASYTNWLRGTYPTVDTARKALEAGELWVALEGDDLYASFILNGTQLPEYDNIPWQFRAERDKVAVIHTLVVSPRYSRRGKARELVAFCEAESRRRGWTVMRLDTYEGNHPANAMYPRLGYRLAGGTEFFFQGYIHEILNCYEKEL